MIAPGRDSEHISFARRGEDLGWVTNAGLRAAADNPDNVFGAVLSLLAGCHPAASLAASEARGPTYAQIGAVADALGIPRSKPANGSCLPRASHSPSATSCTFSEHWRRWPREAALYSLVGTPFRIVKGGIVRLKNTREDEVPQRLTNFVARVEEEEVVRDDGTDVRRLYKLSGEAGGKALPRVEVPAASFGAMNWVSDAWGLSARITSWPGREGPR